jgi:hypothetical protein
MIGQNPRPRWVLVRDHWSRWTAIVELFARRRRSRRRLDPGAYTTLRNELIAACRSLAETERDGELRSYYTALEDTVRPWLSLRVLARTDREILFTLLSRCREVERELTGRRWKPEWPSTFAPAPMIAAGVVVLGLAWTLLGSVLPALVALRDAADTVWLTIRFADDLRTWSVLAVIIIIAAMYVVSRGSTA